MLHRILIADDHEILRLALRAMMEGHANWQVCGEARDGAEAVQKAAELKPDAIILDFVMPGMDGLQAAREISLASPGIPILMFTNAVFPPEAKLEARKCGVSEVVHKGAAAEQLIDTVEMLLNQKTRAATVVELSATIDLPASSDEPIPPLVDLKPTDRVD